MENILTNPIFLTVAALVPALVLCVFVFIKDRAEKEPFGLLLALFVVGALTSIPAIIGEGIMSGFIDGLFSRFMVETEQGIVVTGGMNVPYQFLTAFLVPGFVEELVKWSALLLITRNSKHFNSTFDGIVYAVFVSLGFAALENVLYVLQNGFGTAVLRAILSVPNHAFFGVLMGFYYSRWMVYKKADVFETRFQLSGVSRRPDAIDPKKFLTLSLIIPILAHGFYDFGIFVGEAWATLLALAFTAFLYVYCFVTIFKMSKTDGSLEAVAVNVFRQLYPEAPLEIVQAGDSGMGAAPSTPGFSPAAQPAAEAKLYSFANGDKFIGALTDGKMNGYGTYIFAAGGKYQGNFLDGKFNGRGIFIDAQGGRYDGYWRDNQRNGQGTYYWADGRSVTGMWENGAMIQRL